uniref:Uncharacterized protein n=1 Tax=Cucumis melo TaxID=3656 RepID=A0A9I9DH61_CUCME
MAFPSSETPLARMSTVLHQSNFFYAVKGQHWNRLFAEAIHADVRSTSKLWYDRHRLRASGLINLIQLRRSFPRRLFQDIGENPLPDVVCALG